MRLKVLFTDGTLKVCNAATGEPVEGISQVKIQADSDNNCVCILRLENDIEIDADMGSSSDSNKTRKNPQCL